MPPRSSTRLRSSFGAQEGSIKRACLRSGSRPASPGPAQPQRAKGTVDGKTGRQSPIVTNIAQKNGWS